MKLTNFSKILFILAFAVLAAAFSCKAYPQTDKTYAPVIYAGNKVDPRNVIEFFWSPSCPFCAASFKNGIAPLILKNEGSRKNLIILYLLARNENDILLGELLMCVPQENFSKAVTGLLLQNTVDKPIATTAALFPYLKRYGLRVSSITSCYNENARATLRKINSDARELRKIKDTPGVVINGVLREEIIFLWQLEELIK